MSKSPSVVGRPFPKGVSGNPGGRPKELRGVVELARVWGPEAIAALADIMKNPDSPPAARLAAANALLDRGFGRPRQSADFTETVAMDVRTTRTLVIPPDATVTDLEVMKRFLEATVAAGDTDGQG